MKNVIKILVLGFLAITALCACGSCNTVKVPPINIEQLGLSDYLNPNEGIYVVGTAKLQAVYDQGYVAVEGKISEANLAVQIKIPQTRSLTGEATTEPTEDYVVDQVLKQLGLDKAAGYYVKLDLDVYLVGLRLYHIDYENAKVLERSALPNGGNSSDIPAD